MWISKATWDVMETLRLRLHSVGDTATDAIAQARQLSIENARLRSDLDWFKLRMNAVEKERQMLMLDRIGVKIPVPEFVTAQNLPDELNAMNAMPDLSMIGDDAPADFNPNKELGPDYSGLPVRANN